MKFDYDTIDLPVKEIIPEVLEVLHKENTLVVNAPAGAGKSTVLPLSFLNQSWLLHKKIILLEPRRLAAKAIASRMAWFLHEEIGQTVGYRIRFETNVSDATQIEVVTEGIFTRMLQTDNELKEVALVVFDEFHERSIHADLGLALAREAQQVLRPDLKLLIMSATLDMPKLTQVLNCKAVTSRGKLFPVQVNYEGDTDLRTIAEQCAHTINKAFRTTNGDILAFLPGQAEILKTQALLKNSLNAIVLPLFGNLPFKQQQVALNPLKNGKRKIVLATSIAETSLTIEGVTIVVDSGYRRVSKFNPRSGLSGLQTVQISKDAADQRAGRAGRLSPGTCYRMWSTTTHSRMEAHLTPEIMDADLANMALELAQWGVLDSTQLTWLTPPPKGALLQAHEMLEQLEALENGKITAHGKAMLRLPCHPRIAHMLLEAKHINQLPLAADIAAILEERDPLDKKAGIDINLRIDALRNYRKNDKKGGRLHHISLISASYLQLFNSQADNEPVEPYDTGVLLTFAYPERIAHARPGNNAQFKLSNGSIAAAGHKDDLAHEPWLAVAQMDARHRVGKIFMASPLNPKDLATRVKTRETVTWDTQNGGLLATEDMCIGHIILQSTPLPQPNQKHLFKAITQAIQKEGKQLLDFNEEVIQWQNRILCLRKWNPKQGWPDVSTTALLLTCNNWLNPYLNQIKSPAQLKKLNLLEILQHHLPHNLQPLVKVLAPKAIKVPSGSLIKLNYNANGQPPVLAVRIQEVFGLEHTPRINNGQQHVLLHLLSPGFKPVQITNDLNSFWNNAYFEVKKELKRRYPKHVWPDNPWDEPAIRGTKRKGKNR